jgi:hypothetical protein
LPFFLNFESLKALEFSTSNFYRFLALYSHHTHKKKKKEKKKAGGYSLSPAPKPS